MQPIGESFPKQAQANWLQALPAIRSLAYHEERNTLFLQRPLYDGWGCRLSSCWEPFIGTCPLVALPSWAFSRVFCRCLATCLVRLASNVCDPCVSAAVSFSVVFGFDVLL